MYKLSGIYPLYQFTDSWHPLRSDVLHFYSLLLVLCFIWANPSTFRLQRPHSGKLKHQSSESHSLMPDFDFESDSHFPQGPKMSTFIFKACAVQNKSPESSPPKKQKQLDSAWLKGLLHLPLPTKFTCCHTSVATQHLVTTSVQLSSSPKHVNIVEAL